MWTKFIVHMGRGRAGTVWNGNRVDTSFLGYANVTLWQWLVWWVVVTHGLRVTWVTDKLTDGSRGSWVIKCDPLSALMWGMDRNGAASIDNKHQARNQPFLLGVVPYLLLPFPFPSLPFLPSPFPSSLTFLSSPLLSLLPSLPFPSFTCPYP